MSSGAPAEIGTPIRQPSQALLCIDSEDANKYNASGFRYGDNTPAQIQINKQSPLLFGYMTRLSLTEVNFAWATPNVNPLNRTLTFQLIDEDEVDCGTYRIAIPTGWYKPLDAINTDLAEALEDVLNAMPIHYDPGNPATTETAIWNVVFDSVNFSFALEVGKGDVTENQYFFRIMPCEVYVSVDYFFKLETDIEPVPTGVVNDDLTTMMGWTAPDINIQQAFTTNLYGGFATCQYTPYVDIVSNIVTKNQNIQDNDSSLRNGRAKLARLYLSNQEITSLTPDNVIGVRPFVFRREFATPKVISWNTTENVDVIDLQVLDYKGNPIYITPYTKVKSETDYFIQLGNTANFQFTIQASEQ